jgi:enamine deaminase RidA (YjgF/YER057c/UK114 family)
MMRFTICSVSMLAGIATAAVAEDTLMTVGPEGSIQPLMGNTPARACVEAKLAAAQWKVEIAIITAR